MKYKKGDCFKRNSEMDGWNEWNKSNTIMIFAEGQTHYIVFTDLGYHIGMFDHEIDKYFDKMYTMHEAFDK